MGGTSRIATGRFGRSRPDEGAALVEMALVLPLLLLFGVVEFGRFLTTQHGESTAAREAARYGVAVGLSPDGHPQYSNCDASRRPPSG